MARDTAAGGFPWVTSLALAAPAFTLATAGAALGLESPTGLALVVTGALYLMVDLVVLQPRLEARTAGQTSGDLAAQRFLQRALEANDILDVSEEFEDAVTAALGSTRAVLVAPSPDGGVRILAGGKEEVAQDLGDATTAFLWLGDTVNPIYRAELEQAGQEGAAEARQLMDKLGGDVLLPLRHRGLLLGLGLIGPPVNESRTRLDAFYRAMRAYTTVAVANTFLDAEARDRRQLTQSFDLATAVQESLMPSERPVRRPSYALRGVYRPVAECGGDLWAWRDLGDDRVLLLVADATGHGAAPALLAAVAKGTIDAHWQMAGGDLDPGELLSALNRAVYRSGRRRYLMTAFAAVVDAGTGRITFSNAGQNFPLVIGGRGLEQLVARGDALGVQPETSYETLGRNLELGDKVLLYTDGFTEAGSPQMEPFGEKRFRALVAGLANQPAVRLPDLLVARVEEYVEGTPLGDDMTCVAFELSSDQ
ncbi:MAG TPA: SpoIIE family protein phosphatase [Kofleriaceae bacterium]|nr:SpoIIE family protein phosphatase [Kofleriaceae bacterium]